MSLRRHLFCRRRRRVQALFRAGFAYTRRRARAASLPGWRDEYLWDTVLLIAVAIALCPMAIWAATHPID
jgi:hypothetical protein